MGHEEIEGVVDSRSVAKNESSLTEIVEIEGRSNDGEPRNSNRQSTELSHIGIERLSAGHAKNDGAEREERQHRFAPEERHRVGRID